MKRRLNPADKTLCMIGMAVLACTSSLYSQGGPEKSNQPEKKETETKKVDVQVKVSTMDKKPLPSGSMVEISGQETACGNLNASDARETVNENGEATFRNLPACKVSVKMNLTRYLPLRKLIDLAGYKSCAPGPSARGNGETGTTPPACSPVSLELEPLP